MRVIIFSVQAQGAGGEPWTIGLAINENGGWLAGTVSRHGANVAEIRASEQIAAKYPSARIEFMNAWSAEIRPLLEKAFARRP